MSNQLAKLDFCDYKNYTNSNNVRPFDGNTSAAIEYIHKHSGGIFQTGAPLAEYGLYVYSSVSAPTATASGETVYRISGTGDYRSSAWACYPSLTVSTAGRNAINAQSGFEIHFNQKGAEPSLYFDREFSFTYNGIIYYIGWNTTQLIMRTSTDATQLLTIVGSNSGASSTLWNAQKIRVFKSGNDLYVKVFVQQGSNVVTAYAVISTTASTFTEIKTGIAATIYRIIDNLSFYYITPDQAASYKATQDADILGTIYTNDTLPFQRYLPLLDKVRYAGTDGVNSWTDTAGTGGAAEAFADLTDGNLTTHATTATANLPIGMDSDGTLGDLLGYGSYWTPGNLTPLPTIGIIRSLQSSKYKLASTTADTLRSKFGDGTDSISFDTTTGAIETGETIVNTAFSDNGTFTDGVDSVVIDTATTLRSSIEISV